MYVYWVCDKTECIYRNNRRLEPPVIDIFDDKCDNCGKSIHEPILIRDNPFGDRPQDKDKNGT